MRHKTISNGKPTPRQYSPVYLSVAVLGLFAVVILLLMFAKGPMPVFTPDDVNDNVPQNNQSTTPAQNTQINTEETNIQEQDTELNRDTNTDNTNQDTTNVNRQTNNNQQIYTPTNNQQTTEQEIIPQNITSKNNEIQSNVSEEISSLEFLVHQKINEQRVEFGLQRIAYDNDLAEIARQHSEDMIARNYFAHVSPDGYDFSARYRDAGYDCSIEIGNIIYLGGENLFSGYTYSTTRYINGIEVSRDFYSEEEIADLVVEGWMNSPGHRQNILTPYWENEGIGAAISADGKIMITQNFC